MIGRTSSASIARFQHAASGNDVRKANNNMHAAAMTTTPGLSVMIDREERMHRYAYKLLKLNSEMASETARERDRMRLRRILGDGCEYDQASRCLDCWRRSVWPHAVKRVGRVALPPRCSIKNLRRLSTRRRTRRRRGRWSITGGWVSPKRFDPWDCPRSFRPISRTSPIRATRSAMISATCPRSIRRPRGAHPRRFPALGCH